MTQTHMPVKVFYIKKLISKNVTNQVISCWPSYRSEVSIIGLRHMHASGQYS